MELRWPSKLDNGVVVLIGNLILVTGRHRHKGIENITIRNIATVAEISLQCVCYPTLFTEGNNIKAENHVTYFGYFVLVFGQNGEEKCS